MNTPQLSRRAALVLALATSTLFVAPAVGAEPSPADAIVGIWEADDGTVKLDMYNAGSEIQARILYGNEIVEADNVTFKKDANNPDPALRSRSLKNVVVVTGLHWTDGEWSGGSIYDASSGRTYDYIEKEAGVLGHLIRCGGFCVAIRPAVDTIAATSEMTRKKNRTSSS